ncbi:hypothetical protein DPMN_130914 [Dreissena polymorpha]|uniref:Uncharacterized protein n=1 Tax=Dreissena polymorpha TaxID=45954 RepID=A0A9D4H8M3_DREPO|nr:hypothetical protein DPMN_130914 [Dreissena polymorpha]
MKIAVALFMLAVAASVPQVKGQNWMMNYLMMQNLLGDSTSQSAGANTAAGAGTTGTPIANWKWIRSICSSRRRPAKQPVVPNECYDRRIWRYALLLKTKLNKKFNSSE